MGVLGWIKGKYYDYKLEKADKLLQDGAIVGAENAYKEIIEKHIDAVIHLAKLYVNNCRSNDLKIQRLRELKDLFNFVDKERKSELQQELNNHVTNLYNSAEHFFISHDYKSAVLLSNAIVEYKKGTSVFEDRQHRYKAYRDFALAEDRSDYVNLMDSCISEIQKIKQSKEKDIKDLYQILITQKKYNRAIYLLNSFSSLSHDVSKWIVDCIVSIVCLNDTEIKQPTKISSFFDKDKSICKLAASEIASLAEKSANKYQYVEAVRLDSFASEYLSEDNSFNNTRCCHILEQAASSAKHEEIAQLFTLAKSLKLSDGQIDILKKRTKEIADAADAEKAIMICRLFIKEIAFASIYIKKAKEFLPTKKVKTINIKELREVITFFSATGSLEKTLSQFVDYIQPYKDEYYSIVNSLYDKNEKDKSYEICSYLKDYPNSWIPLYLTLRKKDFELEKTLTQKIKFHQTTIDELINTIHDLNAISFREYADLWNSYKELIITKSDSQPKDKAINSIITLKEQISNYATNITEYESFAKELTLKLVKIRWSYATELEEDLSFIPAISQYNAIKKENVSSYTNRAEFRILICCIKENEVTSDIETRILNILKNKSFESLKEDLAYRYSIFLLKSTRPSDAFNIITEYLPEEKKLTDFCNNIFIKEAEDELAKLNSCIEKMIQGDLSSEDASLLIKRFNSISKTITNKLPDTASTIKNSKSKIENYILSQLFREEQYETAFDELMKLYPNYIGNDKAFQNIAICSIGLLDNGCSVDSKIKLAIAIWLSAVHSDRLFVNCLDYTSWDDQYTFTLQDSLGNTCESDYEELPDNINYDDPIDNHNISIKDVQNSLITRIEQILHSKYSQYEKFYTSEKNAIENLIQLNLDESFIMATPYLAKSNGRIHKSISDALDHDYEQNYDNNEDVLLSGVTYGLSNEVYSEYSNAQNALENCKKSLSGTVPNIRSAFSLISKVKEFDNLYSSLKSFVSTSLNDDIKADMDFKKFLDRYEIVCKALNDTAISLSCANYVNGKVVRLLNDDSIKERDGVGFLVRIYNLAPSNVQVKQNLEAVLSNLARSCAETPNTSDETALNKALVDTKNVFKNKVEDARVQGVLNGIVDKVNNNKMDKSKALKTVYDLYVKFPDNDRVCQNLVTLCDLCISEYVIKDAYGVRSVKSTLDSINRNKSAAFKRHATTLAKEYREIWNQLPQNTKMLLSGLGGAYGQTLNDKGLSLKEALDYYKKLGSVSSTGSFGSSSLFGDLDLPF